LILSSLRRDLSALFYMIELPDRPARTPGIIIHTAVFSVRDQDRGARGARFILKTITAGTVALPQEGAAEPTLAGEDPSVTGLPESVLRTTRIAEGTLEIAVPDSNGAPQIHQVPVTHGLITAAGSDPDVDIISTSCIVTADSKDVQISVSETRVPTTTSVVLA